MTTYFTSDTHFGHKNIIEYCNRPFTSVEEMDKIMIFNWNSKVNHEDTIYHGGDLALHKNPEKYFYRLNGIKHLIKGNHDSSKTTKLPWESINNILEIKVDKQRIILCHYSMRVWNKCHYGSIMLFGHSHGNLSENNQSLDIGVDSWKYTPTTLEEIKQRLKTLPTFISGDHHARE